MSVLFCLSVFYVRLSRCNLWKSFLAVAGSGSKDGKGGKDNNSPSGPYAGELHKSSLCFKHNIHFFINFLNSNSEIYNQDRKECFVL